MNADNRGQVTLNDTFLGQIDGRGSFTSTELQPGLNTLYLTLVDWGGWVGFTYRIDITVEADEGFVLGGAGDSDVDGLTDQRPIDEFWRSPTPPDPALFRRFRATVITRTQINGSYHAPPAIRWTAARVAEIFAGP